MNRENMGVGIPVLHHRIVQLRKSKRVTQEVMSEKIGVTRSALSQYELGSRQPDYEIVKRMADYFNVSTDDLLGREAKEGLLEETQLERDKKYASKLMINITDPVRRKEAISYLEFLANTSTDGDNK